MGTSTRAAGSRAAGDDGLSILETVLALSLFALVIVGVMTSVGAGLRVSGRAGGRQVATQAAVRALELYRTHDFTSIGMHSSTTYETDPTSPDANVTAGPPRQFTAPTVNGATEVMVEGGSVSHIEDVAAGGTKVRVYRYVTWTDAAKTEKRLTVIARYRGTDSSTGQQNQVVLSSVFSKGQIDWPLTVTTTPIGTHAILSTVVFTVSDASGFPPSPTFYVTINNEKFTVTGVSGNTWTAIAGGTAAHPTGSVVELASGGLGAPSPTTTTSTTSTTAPPPSGCASDAAPPTVSTFQILKGTSGTTGYTNSNTLTLSISASDPCTPLAMQINTTGTFGASDPWSAYATTATVSTTGDGAKTVYGRFKDGNNNVTGVFSDTVIVDTISPSPAPSSFTAVRVNDSGSPSAKGKQVNLTWKNTTMDANIDRYQVFRRTGSTAEFQALALTISCPGTIGTNSGTCSATDGGLSPSTGYTYYVVGVDKAGNRSPETPRVSV